MRWCYIFIVFLVIMACQKEEIIAPLYFPALMEVPLGFPAVEFPEGNEFTEARWALGKKLFFDPIMSRDSSLSCASCHFPHLAFSDSVAFSLGVAHQIGTRNTPSLANVAYHPYFTREGGVPTLETQVLVPIQEHNEFDFNIVLISERLVEDSSYVAMSEAAYNRPPDHFVITRSIACFERSLLSGNSPYDQFTQQGNIDALSEDAQKGMVLFFSDRTHCADCHSDFNFTNYAFANNGLYEEYADTGRLRLTGLEADRAMFKVPSLRNVALTAPYMHDGSMQTLEEVIDHYKTGGKNHPNKSPIIQPLDLTDAEKNELLEFLNALTDASFIQNPLFGP